MIDIDVTEWGTANEPAPDLIWKNGMWRQIMFVRDVFARGLAQIVDHTHDEFRSLVRVCGDHKSKSVKLPVFSITWKRGIRFTLRNNFHDWGVSIEADKPVVWGFDGLFVPNEVRSCLEGFPADRVFPPYKDNPSKFSLGLRADDYDLYVLGYLLQRQFLPKT